MSPFLEAALKAADAASEVIDRYYRRDFDVEIKADASPVTIADVESEKAIRSVIRAAFPDHGFFGEEMGREAMDAEYVWLIDPIDGTKSFVRGYPFFSTQIALMHRGELVLGVSNASAFGERAWAEKGGGAFLDGQPVKTSGVVDFENAAVSTGNLKTLASGPRWGRLGELVRTANRVRGYGDFYHYHLLASGGADLVIESDVNILDIAALVVIVREAGGVFTDLDGREPSLDTTSVLAAATPQLHARARALFGPAG